jgi:hypothetical protein
MQALETLRSRLEAAQADALRVYRADKDTPAGSGAFASGRYDGLKQAIELLDALATSGA